VICKTLFYTAMGNKRCLVAAFNIILILSAGPVGAARVREQGSGFSLEVDIDSHQCVELQRTFTTRSNELDSGVTTLQAGGLGTRGKLSVAMKMRAMARVMRRATTLNCEWATGTESNTEVLDSIVTRTMDDNPCHAAASDMLRDAGRAPAANQSGLVLGAFQSLMSGNCERTEETHEEQDMTGAVVDLDSPEMRSQVERETGQLEDEADDLLDELAEHELNSDVSLMETAVMDSPRSNPLQAVGQWLVRMILTVCILLVSALACAIASTVILMILGLIICFIIGFFGLLFGRPYAGGGCIRHFYGAWQQVPARCLVDTVMQRLGFRRGALGPNTYRSGRVTVSLGQ